MVTKLSSRERKVQISHSLQCFNWFDLTIPLNTLVLSQLVNACKAIIALQCCWAKPCASCVTLINLFLFPFPVSKYIVTSNCKV